MKLEKVTLTNPLDILLTKDDPNFIQYEAFQGEENGHKFKVGEVCKLKGLEAYPEFNGTDVTISNIRKDGEYGKAYYIEGEFKDQTSLNWVYEYRLGK